MSVMSAVCSYAKALNEQATGSNPSAIALADHFCMLARERVARSFESLGAQSERTGNPLAKSVLTGNAVWLEQGIIL